MASYVILNHLHEEIITELYHRNSNSEVLELVCDTNALIDEVEETLDSLEQQNKFKSHRKEVPADTNAPKPPKGQFDKKPYKPRTTYEKQANAAIKATCLFCSNKSIHATKSCKENTCETKTEHRL